MITHNIAPAMSTWMDTVSHDVVVASSVFLSRNLQEFPFLHVMKAQEKIALHRKIETIFQKMETQYKSIDAAGLSAEAFSFYAGRGFIFSDTSVSITTIDEDCGVYIAKDDHLQLFAHGSGYCLKDILSSAVELDSFLEKHVEYAASLQLGYLTAFPQYCGTGLSLQLVLHLPVLHAMEITQQYPPKLLQCIDAYASLYRLQTASCHGESEEETIQRTENIVQSIIEQEAYAREKAMTMLHDEFSELSRRVLGMLLYAQVLSAEEASAFLTLLRLGTLYGFLKDIEGGKLIPMLLHSRDSEISALIGNNSADKNTYRADIIRAELRRQPAAKR